MPTNKHKPNPNWVTPKATVTTYWTPENGFWTVTRRIFNEWKTHEVKSKLKGSRNAH